MNTLNVVERTLADMKASGVKDDRLSAEAVEALRDFKPFNTNEEIVEFMTKDEGWPVREEVLNHLMKECANSGGVNESAFTRYLINKLFTDELIMTCYWSKDRILHKR